MLTSKFLTASLTALAVVGSAGLVYAQSTSGTVTTPEPTVQSQPAMTPPDSGSTTAPAGTMNTPTTNQDAPTMDQPLARADRN